MAEKPETHPIQDTLAKIKARIHDADTLKPEKRAELSQLLAKLESEVTLISQTHAEQAESIAGFTQLSTHEATREQRNPELLQHSLDGLASSVSEFETSHPQLVQIVNAISHTLSNLGI